ncbi:uncharacterized protein [Brachionichthys hirsutus]|uniref:uncharacterized protein n=1 Tax=Brachionichthys hirsutus TaxID=412623 RepID=UPI003604A8EB
MEEETLPYSLPDLRELETKVGRKTPESLLVCVGDADAGCAPDAADAADAVDAARRGSASSLSDQLSNLRREMKLLRSADVRILRQLVAVNEGIEAMRWLMEEEQSAFASSPSSSWTGSLSSLSTVEEHRPLTSPGRVSQTPSFTESIEEFADPPAYTVHLNKSRPGSTEAGRSSPPGLDFGVTHSTQGRNQRTSSSPPDWMRNGNLPKPQWRDTYVDPPQGARQPSDAIRRALMRSSRTRTEAKGVPALSSESGATHDHDQTRPEPCRGSFVFASDAQWCWVDSNEDAVPL